MKIVHKPNLKQITFLDERFYFDNKTESYFPSATTVLDVYPKGFGFTQWLKDLGANSDEVVKRAQDQGTKIHNAIEQFLQGGDVTWTDGEHENFTLDEWMMILKFYDFYLINKPETISVEESLVDPELGFGGTLDYVCKIKGEVWYIDWKSGSAIYKTNKIQASAYQKLWNKQKEEKITRLGCMHLRAQTRGEDKTGKQIQGEGWKLDEITDPDHLYKLFEYSKAIWSEENPNPKPKNLIYPDRIKKEVSK